MTTGRPDVADPPCSTEARVEAVRDATTVNGIDHLEVLAGQTRLEVHFLHPLPGQPGEVPAGGTRLHRGHLRVEGGDRVRGIRVLSTSTAGEVLTVTVSGPGDFSTYRLVLLDPVSGETPSGFDPRLAGIDFSFKAGCPVRFDCRPPEPPSPRRAGPAVHDLLAKDYESFRRLMLDRLARTLPDWRERNPADLMVTLVELLAFTADRLSYEQDAVATEAYLGTARRRVSVRRHARLLGYRMHEGCAARAFVQLDVGATVPVPAGRQFLTGDPGRGDTVVFESLHDVTARPEHDEIALHTWTDTRCVLPRGAVGATLSGAVPLHLAPGDLLLLTEVAGTDSGEAVDADPTRRHVVRLTAVTPALDPLDGAAVVEVAWAEADALPFPLRISALTTGPDGVRRRSVCAVARGNVVLVEHGATRAGPVVLDAEVDVAGRWRPGLPDGRPTWAVPYRDVLPAGERGPARRVPAAAMLRPDPRDALPCVQVSDDDGNDYDPVPDLLGSLPEDAHLVVEVEHDGTATLRFGDGTYGRRPDPGGTHRATYRVGHGLAGNVGEGAIRVMLPGEDGVSVTSPLPASGGADPEPVEVVRRDAPHAFRVQERAVTEADYGTLLAERATGVQRASGRMRWTGSWYTAFVAVDREGGRAVDPAYRDEVARVLDRYRMAGVDVEVTGPRPVPLEVGLEVCARATRFAADVERDVLEVLSAGVLPDGRRGLFHPDHFTFGTPVHLSRIHAAVLGVPGVDTARVTTFRRYGEPDRGELDAGVLRVHDHEVAQLANDPDVPERGVLTVSVAGGR